MPIALLQSHTAGGAVWIPVQSKTIGGHIQLRRLEVKALQREVEAQIGVDTTSVFNRPTHPLPCSYFRYKIGLMQSGLLLVLFLYGAVAVAVVTFLVAISRIRRDCTRISHSLEEIAAMMKAGPRP
jgi:hypothetical protein